ncbi:MAG: metal ABC transporter permease [Candidatus Colwellbacteria bacterium]|nr:metal ABC transporter permease [Candidatus Colwellbacteria bacterium]
METIIEILSYPFMQRAVIAAVVLGAVLAFIGIFVSLRRMSFFGDGIAHASLSGVAIGIIFGFSPLIVAVLVSAFFAVIIYLLEERTRISADAVIGIIFTAGMALGALLISLKSGYQPELISYLFGNILTITSSELIFVSAIALVIGTIVFFWRKKLLLLSLNEDLAKVSGINPGIYKLALYIFIAVATVLGIKILGIVLVSAVLIIPVSAAKLVSSSFRGLSIISVIISEIIMIGGIISSLVLNTPTGATIVLFGTILFGMMFSFYSVRGKR